MPSLSPELQAALQKEVIETYQKKLNRASQKVTANQLAGYFNTHHAPRLSEATVHRFFNLEAPTKPSAHTLETLAKYSAFESFADFTRYFEEQNGMLLRGKRPERLGQAYELMQRLRGETGEALASSLRAAAESVRTPAGQDDWMQAWVDLAHLPGYFGKLLEIYHEAVRSSEAQIFAGGLLYLRALLTENRAEREKQALFLRALDPRPSTPSFVTGRWAFARIMERSFEDSSLLTDEELVFLPTQAPVPAMAVGAAERPSAYNYFPAGYHFLVAEALFLSRQWPLLASWLVETQAALARLEFKEAGNVFAEVLSAWRALALYHTGQIAAAKAAWQVLQPSLSQPENRWLWDYYEVYWWLADLQFAVIGASPSNEEALQNKIDFFAKEYQMPFFSHVARTITNRAQATLLSNDSI